MAQFRIDQGTQGTPGEARHDLIAGSVISLLALDPLPGAGVTHTWEILDKVGSTAVLSATTGTTVTIGVAGLIVQPCAFEIQLTADDNGTVTTVKRVASVRTAVAGLRYPMFGELAPVSQKLGLNDPDLSTDNALYADLAGLGSAAQNWRSYAEWAREVVDAVEGASGSGAPTGAAGGDLAGTYPNPLVGGLRTVPLADPLAPANLQVLTYDGDAGEWAAIDPAIGGGGNPQMFGASRRQEVDDLLLSTEVKLGAFSFTPTLFAGSSLFLWIVGILTDAGGAAASFDVRLYDMGAPGAPQAGNLRATATVSVTGALRREQQALTAVAGPGLNANEILNAERIYEVRGELTGDVGDLMEIDWAGIQGA